MIRLMVWIMFWPYSRMFRHRGLESHLPGIGTMTRFVYVIVPLVLALASRGWLRSGPLWSWLFYLLFVGPLGSDVAHFLRDALSPGPRGRARRKRRLFLFFAVVTIIAMWFVK